MELNKVTGVILIGGQGKRMGSLDKYELIFENQSFLEHIQNAMPFEKNLLSVSCPAMAKRFDGQETVTDIYEGIGPLSGIYSAMKASSTEFVFVVSCDTPLVSRELISYLVSLGGEGVDAVIPVANGKNHTLCGLYRTSLAEQIKWQIEMEKRYSVMRLLDGVNVIFADIEAAGFSPDLLYNVNTTEEFAALTNGLST